MQAVKLAISVLLLLALIGIGVLVYTTCTGSPLVQKIDKTKPDTTYLHEVATHTHIYYVKRVSSNEDGSISIAGWYEQTKDGWVFHEDEITLPPVLHPRIMK